MAHAPRTLRSLVVGLASLAALVAGCSDSGSAGNPSDDAATDGGGDDTTTPADTGTTADGTTPDTAPDTAVAPDSVATDTSPNPDGTVTDTGTKPDGSVTDTGTKPDSAPADSAAGDSATTDAGPATTAMIGPCKVFPADNPWNRDVSKDPLSAHNADYLANMNTSRGLHPDWGNWSTDHYGIPYSFGTGNAAVPFNWTTTWGAAASDKLPCASSQWCYPIPTTAKIEGGAGSSSGSDRHVLFVDTAGAPDNCTLYEIYNAQNYSSSPWRAINGAIFHLGSNALRADGVTSADAAGLPILPGLVRYDEVVAGEIKHAIRFTVANSSNYFVHPATHAASSRALYYPPMGLRLRMKAGTNIAGRSPQAQVIFNAMKKYGIILADNGSDWYISGDSDDRWTSTLMDTLNTDFGAVHGSDFEVVETGTPIVQPP